jgi:hypothetical protein
MPTPCIIKLTTVPGGTFDVGDVVRITVAVSDLAGVAITPGSLDITTELADGIRYQYTMPCAQITQVSVGHFTVDIPAAQPGSQAFRVSVSGSTGQGAEEVSVKVRASVAGAAPLGATAMGGLSV